MSTSLFAALRRGAALAVAATALVAPAAHAADGPVVTGIDKRWVHSFESGTMTISGSGFTGATSVNVSHPTTSFTVVSDHTIRATYGPGGSSLGTVQVTAGGITSPITPASKFHVYGGPNRVNVGGGRVTCTIGGDAGTAFDAALETQFNAAQWTTAMGGTSINLGAFDAGLYLFARPAGAPDPLGDVVGNATTTSIDADVTGATQTSIDLAAPSAPFSFPVSTTIDGNPVVFDAGSAASSRLDLLPGPSTVSVSLRGYHARLTLAGGIPSTLDCLPVVGSKPPTLLSFGSTAPAPAITGVTPSTGSSGGGTPVRITGSGFVPGMFVRIGGDAATQVNVLSSTEIQAVTPPRPAGPAHVEVGTGGVFTTSSFTYVGSVASELTTKALALTCTAPGAATAAHPTLTMRGLVQPTALPGEPVGIANMAASLDFSPADVDALRSATFSDGGIGLNRVFASFPLNIAGSSVAGATVEFMTGGIQPHRSPNGLAPIPVGTFGNLAAGSGVAFTFSLGPWDRGSDNTLPYELGIANGGVGSAVTASVLPFMFTESGVNPQVSCAPSGDAEFVRIPVIDPTPSPTPAPAGVNLALKGSATLKTLAKGSVPLAGSLKGKVDQSAFAGDLALDPTTANLVALGFLPVTAKLAFVQMTPTTGTLSSAGALATSTKVRIKLPSIKLFGLELVGAGSTCQAANPTILGLKSPAFTAAGGGSLTGAFAISNLTGCGALTGIVSPLTAGGSNAIALNATPAATPAAG